MATYVLRRLFHGLIVVLGVSVIVFLMLRLSGDPVSMLMPETATESERAAFRAAQGFDDPLPLQFARFLGNAIQGDFGKSFRSNRPALEAVLAAVPASFQVGALAMVLTLLVAFPLGILAARYRNSPVDRAAVLVSTLGQTVPSFWLALMLILFFSVGLGWLPVSGSTQPTSVILPAIALAARPIGRITRLVRSSVLEVQEREYVTTARAKGLGEMTILRRHVLRNALIPLTTLTILDLGDMISGAVVIETVFAWPGVGRLITSSIYGRDYSIVQAAVFLIAILWVVLNLLVDLLYPRLDPRIRLR
jgi:ABC-type dipeptide/oligopeptide/nickel transport system permease component